METTATLASNVRIMVLWKEDDLKVQITLKTDQLIHCYVQRRDGKFEGWIIVVYARKNSQARTTLWQDLLHLQSTIHEPWLVLGDLNVVLSVEEKFVETG